MVLGNSRLLLSRSDLKALVATIHLRNDQIHLENRRATAGHHEVDLLNRTRETAGVDSLDKVLGSIVKVQAKDGKTSHVFFFLRGTGRSPEARLLVSELLSDQRLRGEMERHGLQLGMCLSPLPLMISSFSGQRLLCGNTWRGTDRCVFSLVRHTAGCWTVRWKLLQLSCRMEDNLCASLQPTVR